MAARAIEAAEAAAGTAVAGVVAEFDEVSDGAVAAGAVCGTCDGLLAAGKVLAEGLAILDGTDVGFSAGLVGP